MTHLKVLVLRSNHFYGPIISTDSEQTLQIIDVSNNELSGALPPQLFNNLTAMMVSQSTEGSMFLQLSSTTPSYVVVIQTIKGASMLITKILTTLTIIDLSNNLLSGEIPREIGKLKGLYSLNISNNDLTGAIPSSMGNLQTLESLDLSCNHLSGVIPVELSELTFLGVLNLSDNDLQGSIPQGKQFNTFGASSFQGNPMLCGWQVKRLCCTGGDGVQQQSGGGAAYRNSQDMNSTWEYGAAGIGFAVGLATASLPVLFIKTYGVWYWDQVDKLVEFLFKICCFKLGSRRR
ncbi:putative receptor like protein 25 [Nymphaea colorata]|nr:putative receptor like protein 25 [Nymphaea colorata]